MSLRAPIVFILVLSSILAIECRGQLASLDRTWAGFNEGPRPLNCILGEGVAYIGHSEGIDIVDLSIESQPSLLSTLPLNLGTRPNLRIVRDTILLVLRDSGYTVFSIANPQSPTTLAELDVPEPTGIDLWDEILFVATGWRGDGQPGRIISYDVNDWCNPRQIGSIVSEKGFNNVRVAGDQLLTQAIYFDDQSIQVYSIDSGRMTFQKEWFPFPLFSSVTQLEFVDSLALISDGGRLYTYFLQSDGSLDERRIYDIPVGAIAVHECSVVIRTKLDFRIPDVLLSGVVEEDGSIQFRDTLIPYIDRARPPLISIPLFVPTVSMNENELIWISDREMYYGSVDSVDGFRMTGRLATHNSCIDADIVGDSLFALGTEDLYLLDLRNSSDPDTLGVWPLIAEHIVYLGSHRLLVWDTVMRLVDISNSGQLTVLSSVSLGKNVFPRHVSVDNGVIVGSCYDEGVVVLTLEDGVLRLVSRIPQPTLTTFFVDKILFVPSIERSFGVYDLREPQSPLKVREIDLGLISANGQLFRFGDSLALFGPSTYSIFDIRNPSDPTLVRQSRLQGVSSRFVVLRDMVLGVDQSWRVNIVRLDDTLSVQSININVVERIEAGTQPGGIFAYGEDGVICATGVYGLQLFQVNPQLLGAPRGRSRDIDQTVQMNVWPNPTQRILYGWIDSPEESIAHVSVFSMQGREVATADVPVVGKGTPAEIHMELELESGFYTVCVRNGRKLYRAKIILQR